LQLRGQTQRAVFFATVLLAATFGILAKIACP
jgi:hypothetical protein